MDYQAFSLSENALSRGCKQLKNVIIEELNDDEEKDVFDVWVESMLLCF